MTKKPIKASEIHYNNFDDMQPAPPLSKAVKAMSDAAIERRAVCWGISRPRAKAIRPASAPCLQLT
jgi:hypothetical protein